VAGILPAVEPGFPPTRRAKAPLRRDGGSPAVKPHAHREISTTARPIGTP